MMKKITLLFILFSSFIGLSQSVVPNTTTYTVPQLIQDVLIDSPCALISNITWSTGSNFGSTNGIGSFQNTNPNFPFSAGVVMTSGNAMNIGGPNTSILSDGSNAWPGDADLAAIVLAATGANMNPRNASVIEFDFTPLTDSFSFNFLFASEEYGTFQCSFSDAFAFILTDVTSGTAPVNLALIPGTTTPVSVVTVRDNAYNTGCLSANETFFDVFYGAGGAPAATAPINYNGQTVVMTASSSVIPNNNYHIKLVISDRQDTALDSAVFIQAGSFNVGTANLSYPVGVGVETSDMTIANGLAPCPGEVRVLDTGLNPGSYNFEWTLDGTVLTAETGPTLAVSSPGIYCVNASNVGSGGNCSQVDCVTVEYQPGFVINNNPNDLFSCGNNFDLSQNSATILNGLDPFTYDVLFYASLQDAIDNINQIPALQTTTATVTTFYVRVETFGNTCAQTTQFDAIVSVCQASTPPDMIVCDDITNNGTETFNLTTQNAAVLGGLTASDFTITYHLDLAGANANNNLATPPTAYVGGPNQVIYVRMESNSNPAQYTTTSFNLIVNPLPTAAIGA
ncbi:choice-of-anchor L domain-containing protein, partial [uncultured Flavobacterium sp.]|uniref:choice-of-anchor L domain-containing protein n=1 Tax=uncultured Flavobacterium sp. TaxID=165435 RepID=UPI0030EC7927